MCRVVLSAFVAVVLVAFTSVFAADEAYTIKLYKTKKGDKYEHEKSDETKTTVVVKLPNMPKDEETTSGRKEAYVEEILEHPAGERAATKLNRTYTVAEKSVMDTKTAHAFAGKTVLIQKKGAKYAFSIDGKALEEIDAPELYKTFNKKDAELRNEDFIPKTPVKVGGTWKVPADKSEKLFKTLGDGKVKVDAKKSTIEGKLAKVYKKDGAQFGVLEVTMTAFVTELSLDGRFFKTTPESKLVLKGTIEICIDGTTPYEDSTNTMTIDITAIIPNAGSVIVKSTTTGTEKVRPAKK